MSRKPTAAHLDNQTNGSDAGDPYPGSSNNRTFNATSNPNSNLYSGAASGVSVTNISTCSSSMTATFATSGGTTTHTLTVTKAGTGTGTVTSSPAGIDCGATCSAAFTAGQQVTLTASPAAGSTFGGWSGACSGTTTCVVTMNAAKSVTATFNATGGSCLGSVSIAVADFSFNPKAPVVQQGYCVRWNFNQGTHSATDSISLGSGGSRLFDSGPKGVWNDVQLYIRGRRKLRLSIDRRGRPHHQGSAQVLGLERRVSTPITITWSHAALSGFEFDVQYRHKPAGRTYSAWTNWRSNVTTLSDTFTASSLRGAGPYQFRSHLENASTLKFSGWSTAKTITIT